MKIDIPEALQEYSAADMIQVFHAYGQRASLRDLCTIKGDKKEANNLTCRIQENEHFMYGVFTAVAELLALVKENNKNVYDGTWKQTSVIPATGEEK